MISLSKTIYKIKRFGNSLFTYSCVSCGKAARGTCVCEKCSEKLSPSGIILIDSLVSEDIESICKTVQLSDCGLAPGSGFGKTKTALSEKTLGVPVIAVGTPTVASLSDCGFVSPDDIDFLIKRCAKLVSCAVSLAVFPKAGLDFIKGIIL